MADFADVGAIWIDEDTNQLSLKLGDERYVGKLNDKKTADNHPDYRFFNEEDEEKEVGVAWRGKTKNDREKLGIKFTDGRRFTAVMRDEITDKQPHMSVFENS